MARGVKVAERTRWHVVPSTALLCWLYLAAGVLLLVSGVVTLIGADGTPLLSVLSVIASAALILCALAGLLRPGLRGR